MMMNIITNEYYDDEWKTMIQTTIICEIFQMNLNHIELTLSCILRFKCGKFYIVLSIKI